MHNRKTRPKLSVRIRWVNMLVDRVFLLIQGTERGQNLEHGHNVLRIHTLPMFVKKAVLTLNPLKISLLP